MDEAGTEDVPGAGRIDRADRETGDVEGAGGVRCQDAVGAERDGDERRVGPGGERGERIFGRGSTGERVGELPREE
jgi:hypothetical protein